MTSQHLKPKPEIPPPIKINPSEEEMAFWAAIMELDTPDGASSIASSAVPSSAGSISQDIDHIDSNDEEDDQLPTEPISIVQSHTKEAKTKGAMLMPGLMKQKTKMVSNNSKDKPINDPNHEDDDGYVDGGLHGNTDKSVHEDEEKKKPKKKLPSPTIETNSMIEIGMWQLLKERKKYDKKYTWSTDEDEDEDEKDQKQQTKSMSLLLQLYVLYCCLCRLH